MDGIVPSRRRVWAAWAALVAACVFAGSTAGASEHDPPVKLSRTGICHERGTFFYKVTLHYQAFDTIEDCRKAGGRLPKSRTRGPATPGPVPPGPAPAEPVPPGPVPAEPAPPGPVPTGPMPAKPVTAVPVPPVPEKPSDWDWDAVSGDYAPYAGSALALAFVAWIARKIFRRVPRSSYDENQLLAACLGNRELAERLISHERTRDPSLSREAAVSEAFKKLKRDAK